VVVDEIGKMECLSTLFKECLLKVLESESRLLGSIAAKGNGFIQGVKERSDVYMVTVTDKNRDAFLDRALQFFGHGND